MPPRPMVIHDPPEMQEWTRECARRRRSVGLVPTMGALHDGHLSLVERSVSECDSTIATIFVNPTQFSPGEDLSDYPRTLADDLNYLGGLNVDAVFVPTQNAIYPAGFSTYVDPPAVATRFEGESRPTHFRGVATVVLKLFHIIPADVAYFGQKDFQQVRVIERMVADLNIATEIRMCPIVRDGDGLALSSRNIYLTDAQRRRALALSKALGEASRQVAAGELNATRIMEAMRSRLTAAGVDEIDYAVLADAQTLEPLELIDRTAVALIAARIGSTRLIDNEIIAIAREPE